MGVVILSYSYLLKIVQLEHTKGSYANQISDDYHL